MVRLLRDHVESTIRDVVNSTRYSKTTDLVLDELNGILLSEKDKMKDREFIMRVEPDHKEKQIRENLYKRLDDLSVEIDEVL